MVDPGFLELAAARAQFNSLSGRWGLGPRCEASLVGDPETRDGEEAMRLLVELDRVMRALLGEDGVRDWLHCGGPHGLSPLGFLMLGRDERRAMLAAARIRHRQVLGHDA